jgi:hypothetical protein
MRNGRWVNERDRDFSQNGEDAGHKITVLAIEVAKRYLSKPSLRLNAPLSRQNLPKKFIVAAS